MSRSKFRPASTSEVLKARSRLANEVRRVRASGADDPLHPDVLNARRVLAVAKVEAYVERVLADAPPLTEDQRDRIAALLRGGAR